MSWRRTIATLIAPEEFKDLERQKQEIQLEVNRRVADVLTQMDPFEPFLKKYNVIFSNEWERPEDRLDELSRLKFSQWAYGMEDDTYLKYLFDWIMNTQGNSTLRKAKTDAEWFYGRASIVTVELLMREIRRLSLYYKEKLAEKNQTFDSHLTVDS